jgi:hypothetical protein
MAPAQLLLQPADGRVISLASRFVIDAETLGDFPQRAALDEAHGEDVAVAQVAQAGQRFMDEPRLFGYLGVGAGRRLGGGRIERRGGVVQPQQFAGRRALLGRPVAHGVLA